MKGSKLSAEHLKLDYALRNQPGLIQKLLEDPNSVFESLALGESAIVCTEQAHQSLKRGEGIAEKANALGNLKPSEALPLLGQVIREGLGPDFEAVKVPFGIRFTERVGDIFSEDLTGTASVECTFGLECKGDVDG